MTSELRPASEYAFKSKRYMDALPVHSMTSYRPGGSHFRLMFRLMCFTESCLLRRVMQSTSSDRLTATGMRESTEDALEYSLFHMSRCVCVH